MRIKVTRFAGLRGDKRRPRPSSGSIRVTERGLEIDRFPEQRATHPELEGSPKRPLAWQRCQVSYVYLSPDDRLELARLLLESVSR